MKFFTFFNLLACGVLAVFQSLSAQVFRTESFSDRIKSLQVKVVDNWDSPPVITLEGDQWIEVSFDELNESPERYTYTLTHCNADWTVSSLVQSEYMSGFQHMYVADYETSFNTNTDYIHYRIFFPNEDLTMKVSGNYVARVYREGDREHPVLAACFSVVDPHATIQLNASSITDQGANQKYQQVNFEVQYSDNRIVPLQDLKVFVLQNNRRDHWGALIKPLIIRPNQLTYHHNPALIFEAGNEYRKFEVVSFNYNGLNIEAVEWHAPYHHAIVRTDEFRADKRYVYDEDIDGRYYVRSQDAVEYDIESDYFFAHFFLPCNQPFKEDVYMLSEIFNNIADERSKMDYSYEEKGYVKTIFLKQGHYNYMYVTKKDDSAALSTVLIEGNYFPTENEYAVYVYYRPRGERYDHLIGYKRMQFKQGQI